MAPVQRTPSKDALDCRVGDQGKVNTRHSRRQVPGGGAAAAAIALGHLIKAETFLVARVEVGIERQASGGAGLDEYETEAIGTSPVDGCERTADAVRLARAGRARR